MNFLLLPHPLRKDAVRFASRMAAYLTKHGQEVCTLPEYRFAGGIPLYDGKADMAVVLGGDGTVLRAIRMIPDADMPVWAINYGRIGYLTDCEPGEAPEALQEILAGRYSVEQRCMLAGTVRQEASQKPFLALNEAVIHRSSLSRALKLELSVSGRALQTIPADGILVATPTGSTAYNRSAGGPILMPESDNLVITPICPQMLSGGSIVVSGKDVVGVRVFLPMRDETPESEEETPMLVIDGCEKVALQDGADVTLCRASRVMRLVRTKSDSFYRILQKKLAQNI